MQNKAQRLLT